MSKSKVAFTCTECGAISPKWNGQCGDCEAWNSLTETVITKPLSGLTPAQQGRFKGYAGVMDAEIIELADVPLAAEVRVSTGLPELDRVLGGGLVEGSVILIGEIPVLENQRSYYKPYLI